MSALRHADTLMSMDSQVVRRGMVRMKEEGFASFMFFRKWLVLREDTLSVHKNKYSSAQSVITLQDVTRIERVPSKPHCLVLEAKAKRYYLVLGNDDELYGWQDDIYSWSSLRGVSNPWNFVHNVHVGWDPVAGALTGIPEQWRKILSKSDIARNTYAKDPQAVHDVLDVLEFCHDYPKRDVEKLAIVPPVARPLSGLSANPSLVPDSVDDTLRPPLNAGSKMAGCTHTADAHRPGSVTLQITASGLQNLSITTKECMHTVDITLLSPDPPRSRSIAIQTTNDMESESGREAVIVPLVLYE